mmetsp:Transcript_10074/g.28676  ORF Transcript_10074/g.28676 Transcript_10074/m.28676 type:complete len:204 (+) Transcript_10074:59-670(+)
MVAVASASRRRHRGRSAHEVPGAMCQVANADTIPIFPLSAIVVVIAIMTIIVAMVVFLTIICAAIAIGISVCQRARPQSCSRRIALRKSRCWALAVRQQQPGRCFDRLFGTARPKHAGPVLVDGMLRISSWRLFFDFEVPSCAREDGVGRWIQQNVSGGRRIDRGNRRLIINQRVTLDVDKGLCSGRDMRGRLLRGGWLVRVE